LVGTFFIGGEHDESINNRDTHCRADEQAAELAARKMITITCDRPLGEGEMEHLIGEAKLMQITGDTKSWVGDGMLHMCVGGEEFHFVDQTNLEEKK
jgi:hypothetical protein